MADHIDAVMGAMMSLQTNNSLEVESVCLTKIKDRLHPHVAEHVLLLEAERKL